jgi:transglutaminase-like putative cysteine protease
MRRTAFALAAAVPALVVVAATWLRLEQPLAPLWRVLALAGLALAAAAIPRRLWRVAAALVATVVAAWVAVGVSFVPSRPLDPGSGFGLGDPLSALGTRFGNGFSDFYGTHLPFDPRVHAAMSELVLAAIFCFSLLVALLAAERKPVAAALMLLVGAGWPATLLGPSNGVAVGAAILAAALVLLAGLGSRRAPALALPAVVVVAAGAVAVGSATAARHGLVHWQSWNLAHISAGATDVGFVWNAQYGGLKWSGRPTTVLQVQSARPPAYLRATVLDDFVGDAWSVGLPRAADSLEPAAALQPRNETRETVTVDGLADNHLVGGSIPIRFQAGGGAPLVITEPGFATLDQNLPRGFRYTVWSYTARPTAAALRRSPPAYPSELSDDGLLDVGRSVSVPPFGAPDRVGRVQALLAQNPELNPYGYLARLADEVAGRARTPYGAVVRLEDWFVASGRFRYSNHPLVIRPPLVGFVTTTRAGYCQYFAGAMALMLRYLGIPARVAVGFAGGKYDANRRVWLVSDRNAHAWVEAWFKGYGWLPFDPTPAFAGSSRRPTLAGTKVAVGAGSGKAVAAGKAASGGRGSATVAQVLARKNGLAGPHSHAGSSAPAVRSAGGTGNRLAALILLLLAAGAAAAIVLAKAGVRAVRGRRRDPRRVAAAGREELAAFIADQRIEAPRSATLQELGELVRREFAVNPEPFVTAAMEARFGRPEDASAAARTARRELRALLGGVRRALTLTQRMRGLFSLRSLGTSVA